MGLPSELAYVFGETSSVYHRVRLISREMVAENTMALTIERPQDFIFEAGQNTTISIPGKHADDLREFTIASAPHEKDIMLAMRIRNSNFKNECYALKPGSIITMRSPAGSLWKETVEPQIWISGGIGITPFRSIIRHLLHLQSPLAVTHIHSDHSRASVPFLEEFESNATEHQGYKFFPTMTREAAKEGLRGRITGEMIASHALAYASSCYFVVGTTSFLGAMREALSQLGVPLERVRTERFEGYNGESHGKYSGKE